MFSTRRGYGNGRAANGEGGEGLSAMMQRGFCACFCVTQELCLCDVPAIEAAATAVRKMKWLCRVSLLVLIVFFHFDEAVSTRRIRVESMMTALSGAAVVCRGCWSMQPLGERLV